MKKHGAWFNARAIIHMSKEEFIENQSGTPFTKDQLSEVYDEIVPPKKGDTEVKADKPAKDKK